jgi:hypothetical protein
MPIASYFTFADALAQFTKNISRTKHDIASGFEQVYYIDDTISLGSQASVQTAYGATYSPHPTWSILPTHLWTLAKFETVTGSGGVRDSIAGGDGALNGTINGNPTQADVDILSGGTIGRKRYYTRFDGSGDYIDLGDLTEIDADASYSMGFRIRPTDLLNNYTILGRWPAADGDKQFQIELVRQSANDPFDDIKIWIATDAVGGAATGETTSHPLTADTWTDVIIEYTLSSGGGNTQRLKVYIDNGSAETLTFGGTIPSSFQAVSASVAIGGNQDQGADLKADVSDVVTWDSVIGATARGDYTTDDLSATMVAGEFKMPNDLDTYTIATTRVLLPGVQHRRRGLRNTMPNQRATFL